jgi:RNase P subunit RPR2
VFNCNQCGKPLILKSFNPWLKTLIGIGIIVGGLLTMAIPGVPIFWIGGFLFGPVFIFNGVRQWFKIKTLDRNPRRKTSTETLKQGGILTCKKCGSKNRVTNYSRTLRPICGNCKTVLTESVLVAARRVAIRLKPIWIGIGVVVGVILLVVLARQIPTQVSTPTQTPYRRVETQSPPPPDFHQPLQSLPFTGSQSTYSLAETVAPLTISTRQDTGHYFVKIVDWATDAPVMTVFVRSGQSVDVTVPLGSYKIKYANGCQWYGETYLFGPNTCYNMADKRFDFKEIGDHVTGFTVELFLQPNGNLRTKKIRRKDF